MENTNQEELSISSCEKQKLVWDTPLVSELKVESSEGKPSPSGVEWDPLEGPS